MSVGYSKINLLLFRTTPRRKQQSKNSNHYFPIELNFTLFLEEVKFSFLNVNFSILQEVNLKYKNEF